MYIVVKTFTDSSYNDTTSTYVVDDRPTAVKLADALLEVFVKNEMLDGWEYTDLHKIGGFKKGASKEIWNDKHSLRVEIQEAFSVSNFAMIESRDEYGKFYTVKVATT